MTDITEQDTYYDAIKFFQGDVAYFRQNGDGKPSQGIVENACWAVEARLAYDLPIAGLKLPKEVTLPEEITTVGKALKAGEFKNNPAFKTFYLDLQKAISDVVTNVVLGDWDFARAVGNGRATTDSQMKDSANKLARLVKSNMLNALDRKITQRVKEVSGLIKGDTISLYD